MESPRNNSCCMRDIKKNITISFLFYEGILFNIQLSNSLNAFSCLNENDKCLPLNLKQNKKRLNVL